MRNSVENYDEMVTGMYFDSCLLNPKCNEAHYYQGFT